MRGMVGSRSLATRETRGRANGGSENARVRIFVKLFCAGARMEGVKTRMGAGREVENARGREKWVEKRAGARKAGVKTRGCANGGSENARGRGWRV